MAENAASSSCGRSRKRNCSTVLSTFGRGMKTLRGT